jgi:hypothetical protein
MSVDAAVRSGRKWRQIVTTLLLVSLGILVLTVLASAWLKSGTLREPPFPEPNAYADLMRAGRLVVGLPPGPKNDYRNASAAELRQWLEANQESFKIADDALLHESRVVLPASHKDVSAHMDHVGELRQLCRLKAAAARLADLEGRTPDVVKHCLEIVRIAYGGTEGGLMLDAMTGFACEYYGLSLLARKRDRLSDEQCRRVVEALVAAEAHREPTDRIVARDRAWTSTDQSLYVKIALAVSPAASRLMQASVNSFDASRRRADARLRLLIVELAIRRYRLDKASDPPTLQALVGAYLDKLPADPYTNRPFAYRLTKTGHQLYSLGPDRKDNGGRPFPERSDWTKATGDVLVEPH